MKKEVECVETREREPDSSTGFSRSFTTFPVKADMNVSHFYAQEMYGESVFLMLRCTQPEIQKDGAISEKRAHGTVLLDKSYTRYASQFAPKSRKEFRL